MSNVSMYSMTVCGLAFELSEIGKLKFQPQNSAFDLKIATLSSKLDSLFEASWRDGSH